jgi:hypothetical protein
VFAAVGSLAGCAYSTCADLTGALTHAAQGTRARVVPIFAENGTADTLNPAAQSEALVQSYLGAADLADDGEANGSVDRTAQTTPYAPDGTPNPGGGDPCVHNNTWTCPGGVLGLSDYPYTVSTSAGDLADNGTADGSVARTSQTTPYAPDGTPNPGGGDPCVHNNTWTCPGGVLGLSDYPYTVSTYAGDLAELWLIYGMAHAQPHSPATAPNEGGPYTDPLGPDVTKASYEFFLRHPMVTAEPIVPEAPVAALLPVVGLLIAGLVVARRRTS